MPAKKVKVGAMYVPQLGRIVQPLNNVLTVDCGDNTGWAFWRQGHDLRPTCHEQIALPKRAQKWDRSTQFIFMWERFEELLNTLNIEYGKVNDVILEGVEAWEHDKKSRASTFSGDIFKLAYLVGGYAKSAHKYQADFHIIPARQWKGQMDKDATKERVSRVTGVYYRTSHITDAIGMGLSIMGVL